MEKSCRRLLFLIAILSVSLLSTAFAAEPIKITVASWQWHEVPFVDFYHEINRQFEKENPGYVIEEVYTPFAKYFDKMIADTVAGAPSDVMMIRVEETGKYVSMKALEPLDRYLPKDVKTSYVNAQYNPPVKTKGKTYALIVGWVGQELFYNKELFEKAGLKVPQTPEQFVAAAQKLTKAPEQYGYPFMTLAQEAFFSHLSYWIFGQDKNFLQKTIKVNSPGVIKAVKYYKELFDAQVTPIGVDKSVIRNLFVQGKAAMIIDGPGVMGLIRQNNPALASKIGSAIVPFPTGTAVAQDQVMTIPAGSKNKAMAGKYLAIMSRAENMAKFLQITECTPGRKIDMKAFLQKNPWYTGFAGGLTHLKVAASPYSDIDAQARKIVIDAVQGVLYRNVPVKSALDNAQKEINRLIAK
jgi:multiple sugar transport system substrate-binding protein